MHVIHYYDAIIIGQLALLYNCICKCIYVEVMLFGFCCMLHITVFAQIMFIVAKPNTTKSRIHRTHTHTPI